MNVDTDVFLALRGEVNGLGAAVEELARRQRKDRAAIRAERVETRAGLGRIEALLTGYSQPPRHAAPGRHLRLVRDAR